MSFNFVPAGTILPFGGNTAPKGWLLCDGSAVSRSKYAALYAAIGVNWGTTDSNHFNIPDLRGKFIRGAHTGTREVGTHQEQATAKNGLSNTASNVSGGTTNSGNHAHSLWNGHGQAMCSDYAGGGSNPYTYLVENANGYYSTNPCIAATAGEHNHSVSATAEAQAISGDSETRPANYGVHYIIKI